MPVVETFEYELQIVDEQHGTLARPLHDPGKRFVHLGRKRLVVLCRAHTGRRETANGVVDLIDAGRIARQLASVSQRIETVQPEFRQAVDRVLLLGEYQRDEARRKRGIRA